MKSSYEIVKAMLRTEKGSLVLLPHNKYVFLVDTRANKIEIKKAVEEIYKVKVADVNTLMIRGKKRRLRFKEGMTPDRKKAVVTLKEGQKIGVT
ncbi:MAG: 50S ribosomal protein L23 [Candidatus Omnitrophica bacterium CG07_land_8_20_14_0_80_42_15]|uniref:Large ribosomal subunit protein uL23 n=1 Tax=Candidatus Aquitaenariimonas noxiae TaxID=1974741 RepID=A0A2J0KV82_9BACT|nr:MAG: 50S ribosomal protein L23 [Candidatus Omnitrophica bacterium CG07_land_8_20_14_0_80_42_15]